ncbi:monooxygenase [Kineococcus aurantiacus]|uniref:Heme-degrading monooxygenase HmoA n=1 Tax=Kineococcus aurantiacus TaxID=37633 RepID=A0A7Y9DI59_9ACTN|nr:monooxygenase [Kineococcus aurantiacus]NYD21055.1 heme-degrading monooxygenase HmoA [Kineococcus aurantiacus]
MSAPDLVTLDVWTVGARDVPRALWRMAADRPLLGRLPGARFAKMLGTGDGRTFTVRDADPLRWAALVAWDAREDAEAFEGSRTARAWAGIARERVQFRLAPRSSRGRWSGREPFGADAGGAVAGPVASLTRARLRPARAASFWRSVPPVAQELHTVPGLRCAIGIGEAPLGYQGTFSVWESTEALREFAHRGPAHRDVMNRTPREGWYAEELFARFGVVDVRGTLDGRTP